MFKSFERRLGFIPRWSIVPHANKQTVAEHSFYVALYADKICVMLEVPDAERAKVVSYALRHDMSETTHGDIPSPAKKRMVSDELAEKEEELFYSRYATPDYKDSRNPDARAIRIVKLADRLEAAMWLQQEFDMGNLMVGRLLNNMKEQVLKAACELFTEAKARRFYDYLKHSTDMDIVL